MGSLCGSNTQTTTSQQSTTPYNLAGLKSVFDQVQNAAQTPFTPFVGESVAPINEQQRTGIAGVNANAATAQPFFSKASDLATTSGAPISEDAIQHYINPFTRNVIDATKANFAEDNGQAQNALKAKAAMIGAGGGSGQGVASAELVRQQQLAQAPVIAQLQQKSYQDALESARADRSAAGTAAGTFSNIGTGAQQAALQGAGAQINAGTLEQQTQQQKDAAGYRDYLQRQAFPYQNAQFFSQYGTPAALAEGSSTSGSQTAPGPNILAQLAGLGIAGAGVASKFGAADGGRINYADGGSPFNFMDVHGYIPTGGNAPQISLPQSQLKFAETKQADMKPISDALSGIGKGTFRNPFGSSNVTGGWGASSTDADGVGGLGGLYSHGGLVDAIHSIHRAIKHSRGGAVGQSPFQGYADGGTPFADRFSAAYDSPEIAPDIAEPYRLAGPAAMDAWRKGADTPNPAVMTDSEAPMTAASAPAAGPANPMRVALPPEITGAPQDDSEPSSALAFDRAGPTAGPLQLAPEAAAEPAQAKSPFGISAKGSDALIATGLGIMASRSPFALSALGEGGLHGLKNYSDATTAEREAADKKITQGQNQRRIDMEAQRIAQSASQFAKTNSLAERRLQKDLDKVPEGYREKKDGSYEPIPGGPADPETLRKAKEAQGTKFVPAGSIVGEDGTLRPAIMEQSTGKIIDAVSGKPVSESDKIVTKGTRAPVSDEDARALASYYVKTGDASRLNGMGISGEARQKVQHYVTQVQKEEKVSDEELATRKAEWEGRKAGQRTLGTMEAKMGAAAQEAEGAIKQARGVIERLPRTAFLPMNQLIQGYSNKTLNPDQVELYGRAQAIVNTYAAVMARGANITTDSARGHAEALLNTAGNPTTFNRMLDTMLQEIDMAKHSPAKMREFYRKQYGEKSVAEESGGGSGGASIMSGKYEETKEIGGKKYGRIGKDWFAL